VKINVNLHRDSVHFIHHGGEEQQQLYQLQFKYDAAVACSVRVYYIASEAQDENSKYIVEARNEFPSVYCEKGLGQVFLQPLGDSFDTSLYKEYITPTSSGFPIAIALQTISEEDGSSTQTQTQYTFASLLHCADDTYEIKVVQQKIQYLGQVYSLHEIYGVDHTGEREGEGSRECIVCLSEARDTVVLPCRHMCLCNGCAELMRLQTNKCPICRSPVRSLLHVVLGKDAPQQDQDSGEDEREDQLLTRRQREVVTKQEVVS